MHKRIILFSVILCGLFLNSCDPCDPEIIDFGKLSEEEKSCIPYENDQIIRLTHNSGFSINFTCRRETLSEFLYCDECCDYQIKYEREIVTLTPDYPIFNIEFSIDNAQDTLIEYTCNIGYFAYYLPYTDTRYYQDSMQINENMYYNVYGLKSYDSFYSQDSIRPDSLYINKTEGILKISMSNGEYYEI